MNLYVIRHGQTELNLQGKFQGRVDTKLNSTGIEQVQKSKQKLNNINFDYIYVSPLSRAVETVKIITNKEFLIDERLIERSFGSLEGELSIPDYEEKREYYGIETIESMKTRVYSFLDEIKGKHSNEENILIVTHEAIAQIINEYFTKIRDIKQFRLNTGEYIVYEIMNEDELMRHIEEIELARKIEKTKRQNLKKGNSDKENIHIVFLMVWTKVCGGSKIILEYANRLNKLGNKVTLVSYDNKPNWFELSEEIDFIKVPAKEDMEQYIPNCDIIIPTSWKNIYQAINCNKAPVSFFEQGGSHIFDVENLSKEKYLAVKTRMDMLPFIHTVSSYTKNKIKEHYGKDSEIICNAVDNSIFYTSSAQCRKTINITIIGSEKFKFKNINESLESIRQLRNKYNNIKLYWISQDKPELNSEQAIINPPQAKIGEILRDTDIFICNSDYEAFCLPALEAMTCGAAVITTDNGGISDFVIDNYNALIVEKHNINDLKNKIEELIDDESKRKQIINNGIETAKKFNWDNSLQKMYDYFKNVAKYEINKNN